MTRVWFLLLGAAALMIFALVILVLIPMAMLYEQPVAEELQPYSEHELRGRQVYIAEGCIYCHSQQVRDSSFTTDEARGWGRPSQPADYAYDQPHLLGSMRTGPDLINVGARIPDRQWHLLHLYQPRALVPWSIMPGYPYLFEWKDEAGPGEEVVSVPEPYARSGQVLVARPEAEYLVDYLISLDRTYPIGEAAQTGDTPASGEDGEAQHGE